MRARASHPSTPSSARALARARTASPHARARSRTALGRRRSFYEQDGADFTTGTSAVPELTLAKLRVDESAAVGRGAFSECFRGTYDDSTNVVAKRYRVDVRGRDVESFYADELESARALRDCDGVAPFIGAAGVGQWLVWEDVGRVTLEDVLTRGDGLALARETFGDLSDDAATFRFLASTLARAVASVHEFDMIHRDVKPANVILSAVRKRALLCDVGACADVQTGRNMDGAEAIFDPTYGAPEQFRKVASSPPLGGFPSIGGLFGGGKKKSEASSANDFTLEPSGEPPTVLLDAYSLGVTLLRCGVPSLRGENAIVRARKDIDACGGDLCLWRREVCVPGVNDFTLLDESGAWTTITRLAAVDPNERFSVRRALDADEFLSSA
jgi:hypothetical protein